MAPGPWPPMYRHAVRAFSCSRCGSLVTAEDARCLACGATLGWSAAAPDRLLALDDDGAVVLDGSRWLRCATAAEGCTWLVPESDAHPECRSCRLTLDRPDPGDTTAARQLSLAGYAQRRLLLQLHDHGLPVTSHADRAGGLGFRLLSSASGEPVTIGHADGVVTIDLSEVDHAYRESLRIRLGEPYRTMLGHFRHEIGHYYWQELVAGGPWSDRCRALFGDESASYTEAIERHYRDGSPPSWGAEYISEYATMHPWEDFAESWAHYLHITDTLQTVASFGMSLSGAVGPGLSTAAVEALRTEPPLSPVAYHDLSMDEILALWHPLAITFNQVNRSMGKEDLYPFLHPGPVREKLAFVHEVVRGAATR